MPTLLDSNGNVEPTYADEERRETPITLRDKQIRMEQQVYRIWTCVAYCLPFAPRLGSCD
jgi:hypothetical protein